ncbi:MAG: hypothetical protein QOG85_1645 [Gaiellaceae bacterium]|jgi:hypothetical protein|nr:hypothetical protein [Gaiellaceae bacterium]
MRRLSFVVAIAVGLTALLTATALATGPGGWDHLGNGGSSALPALNGHVNALNTENPGVLYVGGSFTDAGGKPNADRLARWTGTTWSAVNGSATLNGRVDAIAYQAGKVYVGGEFTDVGGDTNRDFLAEWTGTSWTSPCIGPAANPITAQVAALQIVGNTLYVGGSFANGGGIPSADFLVACDLTTGVASSTVVGAGFNSGVGALTADGNGTLYAGGSFINLEGNVGEDHVAYLSGGSWHQMGVAHAVDSIVRSLAAHGTNVYVGTDAVDIAGIGAADHIAKWDATSLAFSAMGSNNAGTDGWFNSFAFLNGMTTSGSLVFTAGSFQNANGVATADDIAYFDGTAWRPLGSDGAGNGPLNSNVIALAIFNGRLVAGGNFTNAGGDPLADVVASHTILRPDARIGAAAAGPFAGNNVYNAAGTNEGKTISVARGDSGTLYVDIQNDGLSADTLKLTGPGGAHGFTLSYFQGSTNVTSQVLAGTYSTASLTPGAHVTIRVLIKVASGSAASGTFLISARSAPGVPVDAVKAIVNAK